MTAATVTTCPAWCVTCFLDTDGTVYHRGAEVELPGGGSVRAFAVQDVGKPCETPTFTVTSTLDDERDQHTTRAFAEAVPRVHRARF